MTELVHVDFDSDSPGQPPLTGGPGQPTFLISQFGTWILVQASAIGIATQPVVLTVQEAHQHASVIMLFDPVSEGVVRVEATVAFDRLADGFFLQTLAGSGLFPTAVVTRLIATDSGEIQDDKTLAPVGAYAPNQPFRVRMDIDMSANEWSVAVDNEMNGFDDDLVFSNLPFSNRVDALPTVGRISAVLQLFPTLSVAPSAIAYDDIRALLQAVTVAVAIDIKPGNDSNFVKPGNESDIPVAILTTDDFDATTVDPLSARFGPDGAYEAHGKGHDKDFDGDGDLDRVLHFNTIETGIQCGDTEASLIGETFDGTLLEGADSIQTKGKGCKPTPSPPPPSVPILLTPIGGEAITQNDPNIGCSAHPTRGFGNRIFFDWTDSSSDVGIAGYEVFAKHVSSVGSIVDTFITDSEFTRVSCQGFVADPNLEGWQWRVRAKDNLGVFSEWAPFGMFRFEPCLIDGVPCSAPAP